MGIKINDVVLTAEQYEIDGDILRIFGSTIDSLVSVDATSYQLETSAKLNPAANLSLSGPSYCPTILPYYRSILHL